MIYPLMDFEPLVSEVAVEDLVACETRTLWDASGNAWSITCFKVIWQKMGFLTNRHDFGNLAYSECGLLEEALAAERRHPYDLDQSFAAVVANHYETIRVMRDDFETPT